MAGWASSRTGTRDDPLQARLVRLDQSLGEFRPIEARLVGAAYRPPGPLTRAATPDTDAPLDVRESANAVERAALAAVPVDRARALAKMYLVTSRPERAVDALAPFVSGSHDAGFLSDTSAAYFTRARDGDGADALDAAARAVEIDPRLVEAWFNFGLASEALGQYSLAAKAWDRVIELDPGSGWARESAEKRARAPKRQSWRPQDEVEFRAAIERGDDEAAARVAERSFADARAFFEQSILATVAERWDGGDRQALTAAVSHAEVAGRALARLSADRWPVDVPLQLRALVNRGDAESGRAACIPALLDAVKLQSSDRWLEAEVRLAKAKPCNVPVPDTLILHSSFVRLATSAAQPGDDLPSQLAEVSRRASAREYFSLQGRSLRIEALLLARRAKYVEARDKYTTAEAAFSRANDKEAAAIIASLIAETDEFLGAPEAAWRARSRALAELHAIHPRPRFSIYSDVIQALVEQSLYAAALRMFDEALLDMNGQVEATLLLRAKRAILLARLGRVDDAKSDVQAAFGLLPRAGKSAPIDDFRRNVTKSEAMVALRSDPAMAVARLTNLIETSNPISKAFEAAELFFLRATAYASESDVDRADQDFRRGFDLVEQRQVNLPDHLRPAAFDRTWDAVAAAIQLHTVARSDPWGALMFAERARAAALTARAHDSQFFEGIEAFRRELPPEVGVVFLSALDDAVLSWGMSRETASFYRAPIAYAELTDLTRRFRDRLRTGSRDSFEPLGRDLYDIVLAPHARTMSRKSLLVIVPDGPLLVAPFAALLEPGGHFLIEDRAVLVAPNLRLLRALSLRRRDRTRSPSAAAFGNPKLASDLPWRLPLLPAADEEARTVAETYAGPVYVGTRATKAVFLDALRHYDVVHFAGHAVVNTGRVESSSLVLAPAAGDVGVLSPEEIAGTPIARGALVVLAACDTGEGNLFRGEGLMGLIRPFIAGGAASVVANLWPIEDEATVEFTAAFHRNVRAGLTPGRALQRVQADFASRKMPASSWAGWVVVGGYN